MRPREQGRDDGPRWSTSLPSSGPGPSSAPMCGRGLRLSMQGCPGHAAGCPRGGRTGPAAGAHLLTAQRGLSLGTAARFSNRTGRGGPGRGGAASPLAGSARAAWPAFLSRARRPRRLAGWVRRASVCGTDRGASTGRRAPRAQQRAPSAPQPRAARELRTSRVWARGSWTPRVRTWPESGAPACKLAQGSRGQGQGTRTPGGD